jgi:ubiquinone/menaquinone biosynthesis C-methylase UbiE
MIRDSSITSGVRSTGDSSDRFGAMEDHETFAARAVSFGLRADAYDQHRPDYPIEAIRWALAGAHRPVRQVLDLAAGTGKLTGGLLATGVEVVAVEPDPGMRAEFTRNHPAVELLAGTAEVIPLPDDSVDAVLVGQAFHWFDLDRSLTEMARVLRPGGVVAGVWNHDDETVDWVARLATLTRWAPAHPGSTSRPCRRTRRSSRSRRPTSRIPSAARPSR